MFFFYSDSVEPNGNGAAGYSKWDATKKYLEHHYNYLMLDFFAKTETDARRAARAREELAMCQRKMDWWKHHPNYDQQAVTRGIEQQKRQWAQKDRRAA